MQSCIFPQELVDYIINFLYNDPKTLKNCSLVCRAYLPTCRKHRFRRIDLRSTASQRFHKLLEDVPDIIPFVRDLRIIHMGSLDPSIYMKETVSRVLTTLHSARNLKAFRFLPMRTWTAIPLDVRTSICALLQLPSLTEVDLVDSSFRSISNLDALLSHCSGLKRLNLTQITFDTIEKLSPHAQHSHRTRLEYLAVLDSDISIITNWVLHPRAAVDVTGLRNLRITIYPSDLKDSSLFKKFLGIVGSSLEHLHLQLSHLWSNSISLCIDVNHHHLRSLRLSFDIASDFNKLTWVTNFFSQIECNSIHEIVIDLQFELSHQTFLSFPWDDLDVALNRSALSRLQEVDVTIACKTCPGGSTGPVDDLILIHLKELFPRLASRGILRVYELASEKSWFYLWPGPTWHSSF